MHRRILRVFEHDHLLVDRPYPLLGGGEVVFTARHHATLADFVSRQQRALLQVRPRSVTFRQYVGTLQLGGLAIEVLPKADRHLESEPGRWHSALLGMLRAARFTPTMTTPSAVATAAMSLLDVYRAHFLDEVERLVQQGLVRRYRAAEENGPTWRGRLLASKHLSYNLGRPDRVYCEAVQYDHAHWIHAVLREALSTIAETDSLGYQRARARDLLLAVPDMPRAARRPALRELPPLDRATSRYEAALRLAYMLLRGRTPDLRAGEEPVLALMLDMNRLFERFVATTLSGAIPGCTVRAHAPMNFWPDGDPSARRLIADLVVEDRAGRRVVLDVKWKSLRDGWPSEADLRQAFAYIRMFRAAAAILLYPRGAPGVPERAGEFADASGRCEIRFLDIFDARGDFSPAVTRERLVAMILRAQSSPRPRSRPRTPGA